MFRKVLAAAALAAASLATIPAVAGAAHDSQLGSPHSCFSVYGITHTFSASPAEIQGHRFRDLEGVNLFGAQVSFVLQKLDTDECANATPPEIGMAYYLHLDNSPVRPHPDSVLAASVTEPTTSEDGLWWYWTLQLGQIEGAPCGSQLDVFFGAPIVDFNEEGPYANRLIGAANYTNDTLFCDPVPDTTVPPTVPDTTSSVPDTTIPEVTTSTTEALPTPTTTVESTTSSTAGSVPSTQPPTTSFSSSTPSVSTELPHTGASSGLLTLSGVGLIAFGLTMLATVRKYRLNG